MLDNKRQQWAVVVAQLVGSVVASDTRGPRLASSHWQVLYRIFICLMSTASKRRK